MKKIITIGVVLVAVLGLIAYFLNSNSSDYVGSNDDNMMNDSDMVRDNHDADNMDDIDMMHDETETVIGQSVDGRDIKAYHYGTGDTEILLVGGVHGGYSWNTALVAYEMMDYLDTAQETLPENIKVTVIPVLNPDGLSKVVDYVDGFSKSDVKSSTPNTAARFNANDVDLNRNFDCDWQETGTWQTKSVSGGTSAFSEPESMAFKNYVENNNPAAVLVWYSSAGGVFASSCHNGISTETNDLVSAYSNASGYKAYKEFDFYAITGDMVNWLAKEGIPGISVLLTSANDTEFSKNQKGFQAIVDYYGN